MTLPPYPAHAPALPTRGAELPQWAKGFRIILMVFHAIGFAAIAVVVFAYLVPLGPGVKGGTSQLAMTLLVLFIGFLITVIPYALANIVYSILWFTQLRGRGYRVSTSSSIFVAAPPLLNFAAVLLWLIIAYSAG